MGLYDLYDDELYGNPALSAAPALPPGAASPIVGGGAPVDPTLAYVSPDMSLDAARKNGEKQDVDPSAGGPNFNLPGAPKFDPGAPFVPPEFQRPTMADAQNEPGYQFRARAGNEALERSAAARGVLRTGGTLKDLVEYGQNFAAQEYGQVFNRALAGYDRAYQSASGSYDRAYQSRRDMFAPRLAEWQMRSNAEMQRAMAAYGYNTRPRGGGGSGYPDIPEPPAPPGFPRPGEDGGGAPSTPGNTGPRSDWPDPYDDQQPY